MLSWRGLGGPGGRHYDCVFLRSSDSELDGRSWSVARVGLFFAFTLNRVLYPCALIHDLQIVSDGPDEDTGMWIAEQDLDSDGNPSTCLVPLNDILRTAHLIPVFGYLKDPLSKEISSDSSLDKFKSYYINKYIDHHAFELAS